MISSSFGRNDVKYLRSLSFPLPRSYFPKVYLLIVQDSQPALGVATIAPFGHLGMAPGKAEMCPIMMELLEKLDAVAAASHVQQFCFQCVMKRAKEQFGGKELLYENGPPPWITPEAHDEAQKEKPMEEETAKVEKPKKPPKNKKQKVKMILSDEEIDAHLYKRSFELSDSHLIYEIVKLKKLGKAQAHEFMIKLRQRAKAEKDGPSRKENDQKTTRVNPPERIPWCPNVQSLFPRGVLSGLNQNEQNRFLAICQNVMNSGSFRFMQNLKEFKEFQKRADPERSFMESLIVDSIESELESEGSILTTHPLSFVHDLAYGFILKRWRKRWSDKNFPQKFDFSTPVCSIDWKLQSVPLGKDSFPRLVTTILKGRHDRIQLPSLVNRCMLETSRLYNDYPPEASDANRLLDEFDSVTKMCIENGVRIAMDATTACHLMSDPFAGHEHSYAVPIRVIEKVVQGKTTNIAVLGKPRILGAVQRVAIQRQFIKYLLKASYVSKKSMVAEVKADSSEPSMKKIKAGSDVKQSDFCDPLDSILPSLEALSSQPGTSNAVSFSENGKTYSVFSIIGSNILVRSRAAPLCSEGHQSLKSMALSFQPKVEYVPNAGAMHLLDAESGWNYCKEIFKQSANHALFRTHYMGKHLLQIQHWISQSFEDASGSEQQWTGPTHRQDAKMMVSAYTSRFARLLEEISHLSHGDYMLVNRHDGVVKILPQLDESVNSSDVLDCEKETVLVAQPSVRIRDVFNGLEAVIPLQWQVVQKRAPGCYVAPNSKLHFTARTPLPEGSMRLGEDKSKIGAKRNRQRKKENAKRRKVLQLQGKLYSFQAFAVRFCILCL
ncbi:unnamed protein product [Haemonchus placei]|uniref:NARG2_C domain-containing protein n=1 Tax=Haemonchus placei TaxID=6290 RepID=A0A0N4W5S8_HAEPC|nr:unnamed protein product [Haemonchus placei]